MAFGGLRVTGRIDGLGEFTRKLHDVDKKVRKKLVRKAASEGGKVILKAAKSNLTTRRTGQLRRSLGRKVKVYRGSGKAVAIVGARKGFKSTDEQGKPVDPVNYAHLVEFGRKAVKAGTQTRTDKRSGEVRRKETGKVMLRFAIGGDLVFARSARAVAARPFMRPAIDQSHAAVKAAMANAIREGLHAAGVLSEGSDE